MKHCVAIVCSIFLFIGFVVSQDAYNLGQALDIYCLHPGDSNWSRGPKCGDGIMEVKYGIDGMNHCELPITNQTTYDQIAEIVSINASWNCRVRMAPGTDIWIPFTMPLWGIVEPTHMHIDNHMNMIFHGYNGVLLGASAYPLKDNFAFCAVGNNLHLHGATKWFKRGTFAGFSHSLADADNPLAAIVAIAFLCSSITFMFTIVIMIAIYDCYLKPTLKQSLTKLKTN